MNFEGGVRRRFPIAEMLHEHGGGPRPSPVSLTGVRRAVQVAWKTCVNQGVTGTDETQPG